MTHPRPPRTLFLVDRMGFPDGSTHGGTTYFLEMLPVLQRTGIPLTVCFMAKRHLAADTLEARGVTPIFLNRSGMDPRVITDVLRIVKERDIEVLHLASLRSLLIGRWIAQLLGRKAIVHLHDTRPLPRGIGLLQRHAARWTDAAIILTGAMRPYAARHWALDEGSLQVLPYGLNTEPFSHPAPDARQRLRREWGLDHDTPLIVLPGRIIPQKGQEHLIRAAPEIIRRLPRAAIRIVGDGAARPACEALVRELRLERHIAFTGYRRDMPDVFAAADIIAIPSMWDEAFGFVALEAMAAGRPVVAYRDGGLPEVLGDNEAALFVPRGDIRALAAAAAELLENPTLASRLGDAGRLRSQQFTPQRHVDQLLLIYRRTHASQPKAMRTETPTEVATDT